VIAACEGDFNLMSNWFRGTALDVNFPIAVNIIPPGQLGACQTPGACWGISSGNLTVTISDSNLNTISANSVRYLIVMEMVEQFMRALELLFPERRWFGSGTEGSQGEGLSRFLAAQFLAFNGLGSPPTGYDNSNKWLASERLDFVNKPKETDDGPDEVTGCSLLFIYYLFSQLHFDIDVIVAAGDNTLAGVYRNLTGILSPNPFPHFKKLIDSYFPGTSTITSGNLDNPFPLTEILTNPGEILWHNSDTAETQIWVWDGHRVTLRATVVDEQGNPSVVGPPFSIVGSGHFSQTGNPDILWHNSDTGETEIWLMDRERLRLRATVVDDQGNSLLVGLPFSIVGVGGPNGDNQSEIVWHHSDTGETQIWFMDGEVLRRRATVVDDQGNPLLVGLPFSIVGVADFTGDGNPDIVWHNSDTGETQIWFMDRERLRLRATVVDDQGNSVLVGLPFSIVGARDLTPGIPSVFPSDQPQIVWHNSDTNETQIWFMNLEHLSRRATVLGEDGNPTFVGPPFSIVGTSYFGIGVIS
jgi:hypothetical protein